MPLHVTVLPRLQVEDWSLYWKESMRTDTKVLDPIEGLELPDNATPSDLATAAAARLGWRPPASLLRLEGFTGPWERCLVAGRLVGEAEVLEDGAVVTFVRVELVAEGWRIEDDLASDDSDDDSEAESDDYEGDEGP